MSRQKTWVRVTHSRNIPLREGRAVRIAGYELAIFNLGDRFLAIDNRCPHRGGPLADGIVSGTSVVCPLHAWKIDLDTGAVIGQPNVSNCVEVFPTRVEDGLILVELLVETTEHQQIAGACIGATASASSEFAEPGA